MVEVAASINGVYLRQETPGLATADVIELSIGQAYDLLKALSIALEIPVEHQGHPF